MSAPTRLECPHCHRHGTTSKKLQPGINIRCPSCRKPFTYQPQSAVGPANEVDQESAPPELPPRGKGRPMSRKTWIWLSVPLALILWVGYAWIEVNRDAERWKENAGRQLLLMNIKELSDSTSHPQGYPGDEHHKAVDVANASEFPPGHQPSLDLLDTAWLYSEPEVVIWRLCIHTAASLNPFLGTAEQTSPYEVLQGSLGVVAGVTGCDPQKLDNPKTHEQYKKNSFVEYASLYTIHRKNCCRSHHDAIRHIIDRWEHFKRTGQP